MDAEDTPPSSVPGPPRIPQRADAERNRRRIVAAATTLYAQGGLEVSMAAVAREAGVGKATLLRHFTNPQQLIAAVFADRMDAYLEATDRALAEGDGWAGFVQFVTAVCQLQAMDRGFADVLTITFSGADGLEERRVKAYEGFLIIIERARSTGYLRPDFVSEDLILVLMANAGVIAGTASDAPASSPRLVGHLLRGFATADAPLPPMPAAPTSPDLYRAMARS